MTDLSRTPLIDVPAGRYRIAPDTSQVHYSGKHMFGLGTVHATFGVREGAVSIGEGGGPFSATIVLDAASFTSDSTKRDKDVRSARLLDVERYPDITFTSDSIREAPGGWLVPGTVTAHGHTVPVDLRIDRLTTDGPDIHLHGAATHVDRTAFGITGSRGMVGRFLDLEIDALAVPG